MNSYSPNATLTLLRNSHWKTTISFRLCFWRPKLNKYGSYSPVIVLHEVNDRYARSQQTSPVVRCVQSQQVSPVAGIYMKPTCRSLSRYSSGQQVNPMVHEINTVNPEAALNEANRFALRQLCMTSVDCYADEHLGSTGTLMLPEIF
jgi:hypothetical protein